MVVLVARLTGIISEPGYATTVLLIAGFGALNALGLSVVGAYAWRAFENTKARPLAIVQRRYHVREDGHEQAREPRERVFVHPQALCESRSRRAARAIWAFAHVLPGARIGADCNICDHTFIENDVVVGDRVTVKCGVQLWDGVRIEDDVFIGPNADVLERSASRAASSAPAQFLADRGEGRRVDRRQRDDPARRDDRAGRDGRRGRGGRRIGAAVRGRRRQSGAHRQLLRCRPAHPAEAGAAASAGAAGQDTACAASSSRRLAEVDDLRGKLVAGEIGEFLPFEVKRFFVVHGVSSRQIRGQHAHRKCHQFLVCVRGSCRVIADDGKQRQEFLLDTPARGVYLPPMTWGVQYDYSADAALLVLASHAYDAGDYMRDYDAFLRLVRR